MQKVDADQLRDAALADVWMERHAQFQRWGQQDHEPLEWLSILTEEVGEAASCANELHWNAGNDGRLLEAQYREEMVQVAAVAVAAIEALDRGEWKEKRT